MDVEEVEEVGEKRGMFGCDAYQVLMREIKVAALRLLQSRHSVEVTPLSDAECSQQTLCPWLDPRNYVLVKFRKLPPCQLFMLLWMSTVSPLSPGHPWRHPKIFHPLITVNTADKFNTTSD